jgi:hypothetical protein
MKILSLALLLMASMAFVLLGCSDNSAPIVASTDAHQNGPASLMKTSGPGAWIIRDAYNGGYYFYDENTLLLLGVNDLSLWCNRLGGYDEFKFKDIYLPNADPDLRRIVEQQIGRDLTARVYDAHLFTGTLRELCCNNEPIAVGTATWRLNDNDVLAYAQDNNNSNAFGYKVNGTLDGPDGRKYMLNFVFRYVWDPGTTRYNEVFKLQLTPTGK